MARGIDLAQQLGVSYRQVHHWTTRGYIVPEGGTLPQGGVALEFNAKETKILRVMACLVQYGMKPEYAADIARQHADSGGRETVFELDGVGSLHVNA
jgi:hypothetical protein